MALFKGTNTTSTRYHAKAEVGDYLCSVVVTSHITGTTRNLDLYRDGSTLFAMQDDIEDNCVAGIVYSINNNPHDYSNYGLDVALDYCRIAGLLDELTKVA